MKRHIHKWINGTRGAIALLLAMLMLPFFSLAAVLVEAGRYQSAVKAMDGALGSSAMSALSNYDEYLLDRFGLLALDQEQDPAETVAAYYNQTLLTDLKAISLDADGLRAQGMYPLSDTATLRRQVLECSKYTVPVKILTDAINLDGIIEKLEELTKLENVFKTLSAGSEMITAEVDMLEALEKVQKSAQEAQDGIKTYQTAFDRWHDSVSALIGHLETDRPSDDGAEGEDGGGSSAGEEWDDRADELRDDAEDARAAYYEAIEALIDAFDDLHEKVTEEAKGKIEFANSALAFETETLGGLLDEEFGGVDGMEASIANQQAMLDAVKDSGDDLVAQAEDAIGSFQPDRLSAAITQLQKELGSASGFNTDSVSAGDSPPVSAVYHAAAVDGLADAEGLNELLNKTTEDMNDTGMLDILSTFLAAFESLFQIKGAFDPALSSKLDLSVLPSSQNLGGRSALELITEDLNDLLNASKTLGETAGRLTKFLDFLKAVGKCLKSVINLMMHTIQLLWEMINRVVELVTQPERAVERAAICGYLAYNLPNRTNYDDGTALTGYDYSDISYGDTPEGSRLAPSGLFSSLAALAGGIGTENQSFAGAELEYILFGSGNEAGNQVMQFMAIYMLRLFLDLPALLVNEEINSYIAISGPAAPVVAILIYFGEPLADALVLANGGDVSLFKMKPYLTVGGIPDLVQEFTTLEMDDDKIKELESGISGITGFGIYQTNKDKGDMKENPVELMLKMDYTTHSLLLLLLLGVEENCLIRLGDLIQMESTAHRRDPAHAKLSQQLSGSYDEFRIDESYTGLHVAASGTLVQLLPIPALSTSSVFHTSRQIYRGY